MLMKSSINYHQIFLNKVLGYCQICEREVKDLARFWQQCRSARRSFQKSFYIVASYDGAYCRNMAIFKISFCKILQNFAFFSKNPLYMLLGLFLLGMSDLIASTMPVANSTAMDANQQWATLVKQRDFWKAQSRNAIAWAFFPLYYHLIFGCQKLE
jgi:hypothetical protein